MAVITIFVEGGVSPHDNDSVKTINNSQRLRESFYKFLSKIIDPQYFQLQVQVGGGFPATIKGWEKSIETNENSFIILDLDMPPYKTNERLGQLGVNEDRSDLFFFMVQEMEAWFLSDPDNIESVFSYLKRVKVEQKISNDNNILGLDPKEIHKPSRILKIILGRYFRIIKRGKEKKMKYNKLVEGAEILETMSIENLSLIFPNLERLMLKLKVSDQEE